MSEKRTKNQAEWDRVVILEGEEHRKREMEAELLGGNLPTPPMLIHEVAKLSGIAFRRDGTDLRLSRRSILLRLFEKSGVSQQSLVEATHLTAATISVELSEMEKEGLVRREKSEEDGRSILVFLTEEGVECYLRLKTVLKARDEAMMQDISEEESLVLRRLLSRMRNNLLNLLENVPEGGER